MATAIVTKSTTSSKQEYIAKAIQNMYIDEDGDGFYGLVASQSVAGKNHKVYFVDPPKGKPHTFKCECAGFYHRKRCIHCEILSQYYDMFYPVAEENLPPASPTVATTYNKNLRSTCYYVDGRGVKIDPRTGKFACLCSSGPCFADNWVDETDACEHIKIVMSDPERVARREEEMKAVKVPASRIVETWGDDESSLFGEMPLQKPVSRREQQKRAIESEWQQNYPALAGSLAKVKKEFAGELHNSKAFSLFR